MAQHPKAKVVPFSSVVGSSVTMHDPDTGRVIGQLGIMNVGGDGPGDWKVRNIAVAEQTDNLLCQDTGIPIYNVTIGRGVVADGVAIKAAIRRGCERATREHPLRSSVVHPLTRRNEHTSCGEGVPVIHIDFSDALEGLRIEMIPKGSGSENNSWLRMAIPAAATR